MRFYNTNRSDFVDIRGVRYQGKFFVENGLTYRGVPGLITRERIFTTADYYTSMVRNRIPSKGNSRMPRVYVPVVEQFEKELGRFQRYFVQKRVDPYNTIIEIDKDQFTNYHPNSNSGLDSNIWNRVSIEWTISGNRAYIAALNFKEILLAQRRFPGLRNKLRNLYQFSS